MVSGTDRILADLKMYTDLSTHYLWGMIVLKDNFYAVEVDEVAAGVEAFWKLLHLYSQVWPRS